MQGPVRCMSPFSIQDTADRLMLCCTSVLSECLVDEFPKLVQIVFRFRSCVHVCLGVLNICGISEHSIRRVFKSR